MTSIDIYPPCLCDKMTPTIFSSISSIDEKARSMPAVSWRKNFATAGTKFPSESLNAILTYMTFQVAADLCLPPAQPLSGSNAPSKSTIPSGLIPQFQAPTQAPLCPTFFTQRPSASAPAAPSTPSSGPAPNASGEVNIWTV